MRIGADGSPAALPSLGGGQPGASMGEAASREPGSPRAKQAERGDELTLSREAQAQLAKLKQRDQQVRTHEAAHMAVGGSLVRGGATYTYQQGPDGQRYAVGGEVQLDAGPVPDDPKATLAKAAQLRAAALAPADPSPQDQAVAAGANAMAAQASAELARRPAPSSRQADRSLGSRLDVTG